MPNHICELDFSVSDDEITAIIQNVYHDPYNALINDMANNQSPAQFDNVEVEDELFRLLDQVTPSRDIGDMATDSRSCPPGCRSRSPTNEKQCEPDDVPGIDEVFLTLQRTSPVPLLFSPDSTDMANDQSVIAYQGSSRMVAQLAECRPTRQRRPSLEFPKAILDELRASFIRCVLLDRDETNRLARSTGLSKNEVMEWFREERKTKLPVLVEPRYEHPNRHTLIRVIQFTSKKALTIHEHFNGDYSYSLKGLDSRGQEWVMDSASLIRVSTQT